MNEDKFLWRLFIHWLKTYQLGTYYVPAAVLGALLPVLMGATDNEAGEDIHVGWPEGKGSYPAPPPEGGHGEISGQASWWKQFRSWNLKNKRWSGEKLGWNWGERGVFRPRYSLYERERKRLCQESDKKSVWPMQRKGVRSALMKGKSVAILRVRTNIHTDAAQMLGTLMNVTCPFLRGA